MPSKTITPHPAPERQLSLIDRARHHVVGTELDAISAGRKKIKDRIAVVLKQEGSLNETASAAVIEDIVNAVLDGEGVPDDVRDRIDSEYQARASRDRELRILEAADKQLEIQYSGTRNSASDGALRYLDAELAIILGAVIQLEEPLAGAASAIAAVNAGNDAVDAWRDLQDLCRQYSELRDAQRTLLGTALATQDVFLAGITIIPADPQYLLRTGQATQIGNMNGGVARIDPEPWPGYEDGMTITPTSDLPAYLQWLARTPNIAWVPTTRELNNALDARRKAIAAESSLTELTRHAIASEWPHVRRVAVELRANEDAEA